MKKLYITLCLLIAFTLVLHSQETDKTWPFNDLSRREAAFAGLRLKLYTDGVFQSLPKGVSLYLDASEEAEDGWFMVTLRQINGEGSGGDPGVSPALAHFYVREADGAIEWYDVVEDRRRPWEDFLRDRREN